MADDKPLTMREIGRRGGKATLDRYGQQFYAEIGRKGGHRLKELIDAGRASEQPSDEAEARAK